MGKKIIRGYEVIETSLTHDLNIMDDYGVIKQPCDVFIEEKYFFGLLKKNYKVRLYLRKGFDHKNEFINGREFR